MGIKTTKAEIEAELAQLKAEHEELKNKVRERVIRAMDDGEICREGGKTALREWGLKGQEQTYQISLNAHMVFTGLESVPDRWDDPHSDDLDTLENFVNDLITDALHNWSIPEKLGSDTSISLSEVEISEWHQEY